MRRQLDRVLLPLFALSGFAGLIYQTLWSHYLGLMLGHAAYAQSLVLAIFMGGMALGAWLASRVLHSARWLIVAYAAVELIIGLFGLGFHPLFLGAGMVSEQAILPHLPEALTAPWQWLLAALLILPQSVLLGTTFPLISAAFMGAADAGHGRVLGGLYFANSIGAAAGALAATFLLLPRLGMPGAMAVAGILNVLVAAGAYALARQAVFSAAAPARKAPAPAGTGVRHPLLRPILAAAAITGATSFVYEVVWIRMLNQALGSTLHSFELMLAAFIFGLACGGWVIRRWGDRIGNIVAAAGHAQLLMGMAGLLSAVAFAHSFVGVEWLMARLPRTETGYLYFNLGSATVALAVMFPAAFMAGMTLPLFTMALLAKGCGQSSVGRTYAANTLGAIAGVAIAVHVLIPWLGLHHALLLAAVVDALLGLYLLWLAGPLRVTPLLAWTMAVVLMLGTAATIGRPEPERLLSGVYRSGKSTGSPDESIRYLRDGKTATVGVKFFGGSNGTIYTNGKPDAGMALSLHHHPQADELTMVMLGVLPLVSHPDPKRVAVVGWGSGMTTHTLLGSPRVERVDTIEIEAAMYEGARLFGERVQRAYEDPRSHVHFDDARTRLAAGGARYDVIVSEPSNPWVSGVANLFTHEFYRRVRASLREGGVFVQWMHIYEMDDAMLATMLAALLQEFPNTRAYLADDVDLLLVSQPEGSTYFSLDALADGPLRGEAARVGLANEIDFRRRLVAGPQVLAAFVASRDAPPHSDFLPYVSLRGPQARFLNQRADYLRDLALGWLPILEFMDGMPALSRQQLGEASEFRLARPTLLAASVVESLERSVPSAALRHLDPQLGGLLLDAIKLGAYPVADRDMPRFTSMVCHVARAGLGQWAAEDLRESWIEPNWVERGQPEVVRAFLSVYAALASRDIEAMASASLRLLERPDAPLDGRCREQMLVIAMLAAVARGDGAAVAALESRFAASLGGDQDLAATRKLLLAWAAARR